jgi:peptidyl-dipeptidase Dcp
MNGRVAELETQFSQKLTEATAAKAPLFATREELAGLGEDEIKAAADLATEMGQPGKFALALVNTTQQPMLTRLSNRETRRRLFEASVNRTSGGDQYDLTGLIEELADLRARRAALLGLPNHATYAMYDRMVKDPAQALRFMRDFVPRSPPPRRARSGARGIPARRRGDRLARAVGLGLLRREDAQGALRPR